VTLPPVCGIIDGGAPRKAAVPLETKQLSPEKALLIGAVIPPDTATLVSEHLDELEALAATMGAVVVDRLVQNRARADARTYIGKGMVENIREAAEAMGADLVIFDVELTAAQKKNVEKILPEGIQVLDRSAVILEIFVRHARTHEAKTQVELAQLEYLLPRLTSRWTHLHRQKGGIGLRGGEGETQLEVDRRMTLKRIARLKRELTSIARQRRISSRQRKDLYKVALVGYTNAGKSSLMNALTGAGMLVEDQLFSTLDSTIRAWEPEAGVKILLIDTVGFIRKLPHQLVASFRSTLEEAVEADLLMNVVDVSHPAVEEQMNATDGVLAEMGIQDKPRLVVFNKVDQLSQEGRRERLSSLYPAGVFVSAATGEGLDSLRAALLDCFRAGYQEEEMVLPSSDGRTLAFIHERLEVLETAYSDGLVRLRVRGGPADLQRAREMLARTGFSPS